MAAFLADEREARAGPFSKWFAGEEAAVEQAEAEWRAKADAEGEGGIKADRHDDDDDDDDDEEEEAPRKRKKKKQQAAARDEPPQRKAVRHGGGKAPAAGEDEIDELRLSDLDDEE